MPNSLPAGGHIEAILGGDSCAQASDAVRFKPYR